MSSQVLSGQEMVAVEAFVRLLRAHASTTRALSTDLVEQHGLTINDYEALLRLSRADDQMMRRIDLSRELLLTASGVTRLLDGLERTGLVEKATCASDGRVTYAVLTQAGREKLQRASESHLAAVRSLLGGRLSDDELSTLSELLGRLDGVAAEVKAEDCTPG